MSAISGDVWTFVTPSFVECTNYTSLSSNDRKMTYGRVRYDQCDKNIGPAWLRFEGEAGTRMASSCPPRESCDASSPGWMNGDHPSVAEGQVTRQACFHTSKGTCGLSTDIKVRNCGRYYVYYLRGTPDSTCMLRYCGSDQD